MSSQVKILLVSFPLTWDKVGMVDLKPPVNLIYLASWLNSRGIAAAILDASQKQLNLGQTLVEISRIMPDWVGIPFYQGTEGTAAALCRALRQQLPQVRIVGGGPLLTAMPQRIIDGQLVDFAITGEGEKALEGLLQADRQASGATIAVNGEEMPDLDGLPFLDYGLVEMPAYFALQEKLNVPHSIFMTTSRGCACRCTYCASPKLWPGKVRRYSVGRVLSEVAFHRNRYGRINIGFLDDSFFSDRSWLEEFFAGIRNLDVTYSCIGRADHIDAGIALKLKETGCNFVSMGVETASPVRQKALRKFLDLDRVRSTVSYLAGHGIYSRCFFMLGFPDETAEEMAATINFAIELKKLGMSDCTFFPVVLYAGTELSENFGADLWQSQIHQAMAELQTGRLADEKLARYSSVPASDVNAFFNHEGMIRIVQAAYHAVEKMKPAAAEELKAMAERQAGA